MRVPGEGCLGFWLVSKEDLKREGDRSGYALGLDLGVGAGGKISS